MTYQLFGFKPGVCLMSGDTPEQALSNACMFWPRDRVAYVWKVAGNRVWVRYKTGRSAYCAYMIAQADLPRDPRSDCLRRHMTVALEEVGNGADAGTWDMSYRIRRANCTVCNHAARRVFGNPVQKKPIVNTVVSFGQKSKAHWNTENVGMCVSEYSRNARRGGRS
jgi:hypothetical protein